MKLSITEISSKIEALNIPKERIVKFACDCALINVELIKQYTTDEDYQMVVNFLNNPTYNAALAANAADAAYHATHVALAADADAAYYAADADAAANAAYAAYAAYAALTADAADAADAAADAGNSDKVDTLINELFAEFK